MCRIIKKNFPPNFSPSYGLVDNFSQVGKVNNKNFKVKQRAECRCLTERNRQPPFLIFQPFHWKILFGENFNESVALFASNLVYKNNKSEYFFKNLREAKSLFLRTEFESQKLIFWVKIRKSLKKTLPFHSFFFQKIK